MNPQSSDKLAKRRSRTYRMVLVAYNDPEQFVLQVTYLDSKGNVTDRVLSPTSFVDQDTIKAYCLGRLGVRTFKLDRIIRIRLRHASDVLAPEAVEVIVSHNPRRRRR